VLVRPIRQCVLVGSRAEPLSLEEAVMLQVYWLVASALSGSFLVRC
jgi:hypothetical protein